MNEEFEQKLDTVFCESSLSRVWTHNMNHDCGAMTAFRKGPDCGKGEKYSKKENKQRNKSLLAKLKSKGYGITKLKGVYPEGGETVKENSFFIVDLKDTGKLEADLREIGEYFDQDSVLFVPKGAVENKDVHAYLIGTNHCEDKFLGYGKKLPFKKGKLGKESTIYTSYVNGRPFIFESVGSEVASPASGYGVWAMNEMANREWRELDV
jgi:hypothetical protein